MRFFEFAQLREFGEFQGYQTTFGPAGPGTDVWHAKRILNSTGQVKDSEGFISLMLDGTGLSRVQLTSLLKLPSLDNIIAKDNRLVLRFAKINPGAN